MKNNITKTGAQEKELYILTEVKNLSYLNKWSWLWYV